MPKETFGGDDSGGGTDSGKKRPALGRFGLSPDTNIRDVFWKIMESYKKTEKPGVDLATLEHDRFSLVRVALTVLSGPAATHQGFSTKNMALFSTMMILDGGWVDTFSEFLEKGMEQKGPAMQDIVSALKKLLGRERYAELITSYLAGMVRGRRINNVALAYLAAVENAALSRTLKKEITIFARGDIGENQVNAIKAISIIEDDAEVKKSLMILITHWDHEARKAAALALEAWKKDEEVKNAALARMKNESDEEVKKILQRIAK